MGRKSGDKVYKLWDQSERQKGYGGTGWGRFFNSFTPSKTVKKWWMVTVCQTSILKWGQ